jgi:hypothetical protein
MVRGTMEPFMSSLFQCIQSGNRSTLHLHPMAKLPSAFFVPVLKVSLRPLCVDAGSSEGHDWL